LERIKQQYKILLITATVPVLALLYFFADARYSNFFPRCPIYSLTGLLCPGCGSQRAISSLLHGDVMQAINYNVLLVMSLPLLIYSAFVSLSNMFRTKPIIQKIFYSTAFVKIVFVVVVLFGVFRNIPMYLFTMLAPSVIILK
jgi:hypothetical protein